MTHGGCLNSDITAGEVKREAVGSQMNLGVLIIELDKMTDRKKRTKRRVIYENLRRRRAQALQQLQIELKSASCSGASVWDRPDDQIYVSENAVRLFKNLQVVGRDIAREAGEDAVLPNDPIFEERYLAYLQPGV